MEQANLSYIERISKGEKAFEKQIIDILKEELSQEIENYYKFLKENNLQKTKVYVHRIKHKMSILGLDKSYELTNIFENSLRDNKFENKVYFENMLPVMINFLKTL